MLIIHLLPYSEFSMPEKAFTHLPNFPTPTLGFGVAVPLSFLSAQLERSCFFTSLTPAISFLFIVATLARVKWKFQACSTFFHTHTIQCRISLLLKRQYLPIIIDSSSFAVFCPLVLFESGSHDVIQAYLEFFTFLLQSPSPGIKCVYHFTYIFF